MIRLFQRFVPGLFLGFCLGSGVVVCSSVDAAELEGVKLADTVTVNGQTLVLNGLGLRTKLFFKVYVAGLYLPGKTADGANALSQPGAKRIAFTLKRNVKAEDFAKALDDGVRERNSPEQFAVLADRLKQLVDIILSVKEVKEGDQVWLDLVPSTGLIITHNGGTPSHAIVGDDLFRAVLDIFVGAKPVQDSLKTGLLAAK